MDRAYFYGSQQEGWAGSSISVIEEEIKTEAKAKAVACVWGGGEGIKFLAALAVLPRTILIIG